PGGCNGLVQSLRAQLGTLQYDGDRLLSGCAADGVALRTTRDLELRSGCAVHLARFSGAAQETRHLDQYGWTRPCSGQRVHRAAMAQPEVRTHLPRRLRQRSRVVGRAKSLLPFLQPPAPASGARLPHAGRPVSAPVKKETVITIMGALPPNPP